MAGPRKSSSPARGGARPSRPSRPGAGRSSAGRRQAGGPAPVDDGPPKPRRAPSKPKRDRAVVPFAANEREQAEGVRLQKFMASAGVSSRRRAEDLIASGAVTVNGRVVTEPGSRVFPGRDRVTVHGRPIQAEAKVYYLLNKPDEIVCSAAGSVDERGRPTVLSLMHGMAERLYPVGRLDYHSRGLVLLTNDGDLAEALTHPRHGVVKTYHVKFQGKLDEEDEAALRDGVTLDDGAITRPVVELFAFRETETNVWYQIGIKEGLNRQLRRMGDAIDHPVLKLIRVAIGDLTADGLGEGEFRPLTSTEVGQLLAAVKLAPEGKRKPAAAKPAAARKPARAASASEGPTRSAKPARAGPKPARGASASEGRSRPSKPGAGGRGSTAKAGASDGRPSKPGRASAARSDASAGGRSDRPGRGSAAKAGASAGGRSAKSAGTKASAAKGGRSTKPDGAKGGRPAKPGGKAGAGKAGAKAGGKGGAKGGGKGGAKSGRASAGGRASGRRSG